MVRWWLGAPLLPFLPTRDGVKGPLGREGVHWRAAGEPATSKHDCRPDPGHAMLSGGCGDDSLDLRGNSGRSEPLVKNQVPEVTK